MYHSCTEEKRRRGTREGEGVKEPAVEGERIGVEGAKGMEKEEEEADWRVRLRKTK